MTTAEIPYATTVSGSDDLDVDELGTQIIQTAGRLAAATCRWLLLIAAFDARGGAARAGLPSTWRWLMHYCGLSRRAAIDHLRVARVLAAHPPLAEAMGAGPTVLLARAGHRPGRGAG